MKITRSDLVALNGPTGEHYLVERIARIIAGDDAGKERWELFIPMAMKILEEIENEAD